MYLVHLEFYQFLQNSRSKISMETQSNLLVINSHKIKNKTIHFKGLSGCQDNLGPRSEKLEEEIQGVVSEDGTENLRMR